MYIKENTKEKIISSISGAEIATAILNSRAEEEKHKEYFYIIGLNSLNCVIVVDLISIGTVNRGAVYIREIVKTLLIKNCVSCIVFHNHPSGETIPSKEDKTITIEIQTALGYMDIKLLDHLIIGDNKYYSFCDEGIM